ncbi:MAG: zinc-ribbon domain-containing protein [Promethearchaeota archaeon]|nr:MAG: zinc-ribbon domain-containing protein [Candidatus Lokiarchaeota archaeon]
MSDEDRQKDAKKNEGVDSFYSDILDALDDLPPNVNAGETKDSEASVPTPQGQHPQLLFPFAPDMNDPNAYPDFQGAKYYVDTQNYPAAVATLINILRVPQATNDKNMASELILELAKTDPDQLFPLLPYLLLIQDTNDPIIEMNINNSLLYIRDPYNNMLTQLKAGVKAYIQSYYEQLNTTYIPFVDILSALGTSLEVIIKILEIMSKNREISGKIDFTTQVFAYEPPGALFLCPHCGVELDKNAKFCPSCKEDVFKCAICFRFIKPNELVNCPKCGIPAHEQHFLEWVKKTGSCPVCQNKLYEQEVAHISCIVCGLEIKKDEKDIVKCPYCGTLAHTDHFLDYIKMSKVCPECRRSIDYKDFKKSLKK